jgi:hypothetical protein
MLRDYRYPHSDYPCEHYESDLFDAGSQA